MLVCFEKHVPCTSKAVSLSPSPHLALNYKVDRLQEDLSLVSMTTASFVLKSQFFWNLFSLASIIILRNVLLCRRERRWIINNSSMLILRSTRYLGVQHSLRGTSSIGEPSITHSDKLSRLWHQKTFPFLLVIYFSNLKKKSKSSDTSSMIVIFIEFVTVIPNSCSFFFFNHPYRAAPHRLKLVKVYLKAQILCLHLFSSGL